MRVQLKIKVETKNSEISNRSIRVAKVLNAPIELVWEVWTNPSQISHWWAPKDFTTSIKKMDVSIGGEWLLDIKGPDGKNFPNKSIYRELVPYKKIVFQHFNPHYLATVLFESRDEETFMDWNMEFETQELYDTIVKVFKADEGLKQNVEKLENYLSLRMK